ncbi:hypothetical protein [Nocardia sp. NPDC059239]|uniref:hypothetical protein n=1 Tax=unclassified Nocardia TaxID=2637762 RepID=UPI0036CFFD9D
MLTLRCSGYCWFPRSTELRDFLNKSRSGFFFSGFPSPGEVSSLGQVEDHAAVDDLGYARCGCVKRLDRVFDGRLPLPHEFDAVQITVPDLRIVLGVQAVRGREHAVGVLCGLVPPAPVARLEEVASA